MEETRTETVDGNGVLRVEIPGLTPGRRMRVVVLDFEEESETADSNPDVEDFA